MTLPYYLKSLEILIHHYTVPVALAKSIDDAPEVFKPGLRKLVNKIEAGDSSINPYMDFAIEYPVRDSMRMMRLLYRLSLGSQERKQEQLIVFSKTISNLHKKIMLCIIFFILLNKSYDYATNSYNLKYYSTHSCRLNIN